RRRFVASVHERDGSRGCVAGGDDPIRSRDRHEILGTDETANELDVSQRVAPLRCRGALGNCKRDREANERQSSHRGSSGAIICPPGSIGGWLLWCWVLGSRFWVLGSVRGSWFLVRWCGAELPNAEQALGTQHLEPRTERRTENPRTAEPPEPHHQNRTP